MPVTSSNAAAGSVIGAPRRQYVSINAFNADFFSYTTSTDFTNGNFVTTGSLGPVSGATSGNCPEGRVLRENGKKLFPNANPGVETYMVGVYDSTTFLNGFIDPNSRKFQPQSTDLPTYLPNPVDSVSDTTDFGPGAYTRGDVITTDGNIEYRKDISGEPFAGIYSNEGDLNPYIGVGSYIEQSGGDTKTNQIYLSGDSGNITYTGILEPQQSIPGYGASAGELTSGTDQHCSTYNRLISGNNVFVMVTRVATASGTPGHLTYTITNTSTLTISSSESTDRYTCNYFLIGND